MSIRARGMCLSALFLLLPLAACQSTAPGAGAPSLAAMPPAAAGVQPSAQRLDEDGYPMLGAYPGAAASQLTDAEVAQESARLQAAAAAQNSTAPSGDYEQSIQALEAVRERQQARAREALSGSDAAPASGPTPEEVLREIQGS